MMFHLYCRGRQTACLSEQGVRYGRLTAAIRILLQLCGWLIFAVGCFVAGGYAQRLCQEPIAEAPAPADYYQAQEHYVFKNRPLPVPEEIPEDEAEENETPEASPEPAAPEGDSGNAELKQRVKAAMAELDAP